MNDQRLTQVQKEQAAAIQKSDAMYNGLLADQKTLLDKQNTYADTYKTTQDSILDKQLEYNTGLIEQQKEEARKEKKRETNKALNDYTAYVNPYGRQAELLASSNLNNSGVSETSKLGAYTTYQNRVSAANTALQGAITAFDNDINAARLQNDVGKAENALEVLKMQMDYLSTYYTNTGRIKTDQLSNSQNLNDNYYNRYQNVIKQINYEKEQAEAQRQFNEKMAYQRQRDAIADQQWQKQYELSLANATRSSGGSSGGSSRRSSNGGSNDAYELSDNQNVNVNLLPVNNNSSHWVTKVLNAGRQAYNDAQLQALYKSGKITAEQLKKLL